LGSENSGKWIPGHLDFVVGGADIHGAAVPESGAYCGTDACGVSGEDAARGAVAGTAVVYAAGTLPPDGGADTGDATDAAPLPDPEESALPPNGHQRKGGSALADMQKHHATSNTISNARTLCRIAFLRKSISGFSFGHSGSIGRGLNGQRVKKSRPECPHSVGARAESIRKVEANSPKNSSRRPD
jgi:hypothetical protein